MNIKVGHAIPEDFAPFISQTFVVHVENTRFELLLDNVKIFEQSSIRDNVVIVDGEELPPRRAFALTFEGPREPILNPSTYTISNAEMGEMTVYLSPFRQDATCTLYEVVFN